MTQLSEIPSRPHGKAKNWDREAILLLALLSLGDVDAAVTLWDSLSPPRMRGLLEAETIENAKAVVGKLPPMWFDVESQRYGLGNSGAIPQAVVFGLVDAVNAAAQVKATSELAKVYAGTVDIDVWQQGFAQWLRQLALSVTAAAVGGVKRLTGADLSNASEALIFPFTRLTRFAKQIETGEVERDRAITRAGMYAATVMVSLYDTSRERSHEAANYTLVQNILDPEADHCRTIGATPGCLELTQRGWVKIGTMPPPGERSCLWNCRCHLSFRRFTGTE